LHGGTAEQKQYFLPRLAAGEMLAAISITEPDYGSDVASLSLKASQTTDGWSLNGAKTWCTFAGKADVIVVIARTDPDRSKGHKGLSMFMVEKPRFSWTRVYLRESGWRPFGGARHSHNWLSWHALF
jgi:(2S)-methylsuccinyl-CoA dehydrogenase